MSISVIIPSYNHQNFIEETIKSIIDLKLIEKIIVVDDCSSDNTVEIVKAFSNSKILLIEKNQNRGVVDSLNTGIKLAKSKYLYFCASDDVPICQGLESIYYQCLQNEYNFFIGGGHYIDFDGNVLKNIYSIDALAFLKNIHKDIESYLFLKYPKPLLLQSSLFSREFINEIGSFDNLMIDDYPLFIKCFRYKPLNFSHDLNQECVKYRVHDSNFSNNSVSQLITQIEVFKTYCKPKLLDYAVANRLSFHMILNLKKLNFVIVIKLIRLVTIRQLYLSFCYLPKNLINLFRNHFG